MVGPDAHGIARLRKFTDWPRPEEEDVIEKVDHSLKGGRVFVMACLGVEDEKDGERIDIVEALYDALDRAVAERTQQGRST